MMSNSRDKLIWWDGGKVSTISSKQALFGVRRELKTLESFKYRRIPENWKNIKGGKSQ